MSADVTNTLVELVANARRTFTSPISKITPRTLARQLDDFRAGTLREFALTCETIEERDDVLANVVPKAKSAVARHGFEVCVLEQIPAGMEAAAAKQKEALEHFYNNLRVTSAMEPDELGEFSLLVRQIMDAKGKRYSVNHIVWQPDSSGLYTARFIHVPLWFFENRTGPLRFIRTPFGYDGEPMEPGAWLVSVGQGIMRACSIAWMFKRMPLHSWVGYCEKHGFPFVIGKTPAAKGTPEWDAMIAAVRSISEDSSGVINSAAEITLLEAKGAGSLPYPALVELMNRALASLWRGADLSTISAGQGKGQGASLQGEESSLIEQDDAAWVSETLRLKVDRLVLDYVFGEGTPALAYVKVKGAAKKETDLDLQVDEFLLGAGFPISKAQASERYSRPLPGPDDSKPEDLLKAPVAAPQPDTEAGKEPKAESTAINELTPVNAGAAVFRANAIRKLTQAQSAAVQPVLDRIAALKELPADGFAAGLQALRNDLPRLFAEARLHTPDIAAVWEQVLGTALVDGMTDLPQKP
ncbi:MAG: DUF935 family protein [Opitutaceae bacterium]|jgi:hypothetical protein